jgi:hypothetical protein
MPLMPKAKALNQFFYSKCKIMQKKKRTISNLDGRLNRTQMSQINGGTFDIPPDGDGKGLCLGCSSNDECQAVNKGTCEDCQTHGKKCCSGWHSHS